MAEKRARRLLWARGLAALLSSFFWAAPSAVNGQEAAVILQGVEQDRRRLAERATGTCDDGRAIKELSVLLDRFFELRCAPGGQLLVAKASHYVSICFRECGGSVVFSSAADRPFKTPGVGETQLVFEKVLSSPISLAERNSLKIAGSSEPFVMALERILRKSLADAPFQTIEISMSNGTTAKWVWFELPSQADSIVAYPLEKSGDLVPIGLQVMPMRDLEAAARANPLRGG
ncbi:hypothetical protein [uncultured Enterovirga sp.]|uniref:hypothetical protein n=1 Tax=uncultured Enterovirga sp. TaxID=2026352 RepID=UPI0035CC329A